MTAKRSLNESASKVATYCCGIRFVCRAFAPLREVPQPGKSRFRETNPIFRATHCHSDGNIENNAASKTYRSPIRDVPFSSLLKPIQGYSRSFKPIQAFLEKKDYLL
jgi:hypothetical protein